MSYTLKFSDPTKSTSVTVPDMPPGINNYSTSISLFGPGYPNYGEKIASNFLHILENFAGPYPPPNAIEGQLWYDTSDPSNKVLRVMDGTATSTRWPSATGIYQQNNDPNTQTSVKLKAGDIWVDTLLNQLKIFNNNSWTVVGPTVGSGESKTGTEATTLTDTNGVNHPVIMSYVDGTVVAITAISSFVPNPVIDGFTRIKPGITLCTTTSTVFNAVATSAVALRVNNTDYSGDSFLRKDDRSRPGQVISGNVLFQSTITIASATNTSEFVQLYKDGSNAVLYNNKATGSIVLKTRSVSESGPSSTLEVSNTLVTINTATSISGNVTLEKELSVQSTATVSSDLLVDGNIVAGADVNTGSNLSVVDTVTIGNSNGSGTAVAPANAGTYDIGTTSTPFRSIYASDIHADKFNGSALYFPGMIVPFGGTTAPQGWLLCNGASYTTSTHAALFSVIGYKYGSTSPTTAKVPNMSTSTFISTGTNTGTYLTYIIKL